jgi:hypothetical protein
MALPSSGSLAFSQIRQELTINGYVGSYSLQGFDHMAFGGYAPYQVSEFFGYSAAPAESIQYYIPMYETWFMGYGYACSNWIQVGVSNLGKHYLWGGLGSPLNGNYADESGHVMMYSNGDSTYGQGWCEFV